MDNSLLFKRIYGCLLGGLIGDAMGAPTEGKNFTDIKKEYGELGDFEGGGTDEACKACRSIGPMVGRLITMEVRVAPDMICGRRPPIPLTMGLIAIRIGYLKRSVRSLTPLARAVITYCFCNSSSRLPRITRIIPAVPDVPMTMMGMGRCLSKSTIFPKLQGAHWYSGPPPHTHSSQDT